MANEVGLHPDAALELLETTSWYERRSSKVAARFVTEIELALVRITEAPNRWPKIDGTHRRLLVRRFPYLLIYRILAERLWIVAVAHAHRRPGYWRDRSLDA